MAAAAKEDHSVCADCTQPQIPNALMDAVAWNQRFNVDCPPLWTSEVTPNDLFWIRGALGIPAFPASGRKNQTSAAAELQNETSEKALEQGLDICLLVYQSSFTIADGAGQHFPPGHLNEQRPSKQYNQTVVLPWIIQSLEKRFGPKDKIHVQFIADDEDVESVLEKTCSNLGKKRVVATACEDPAVMKSDSKTLFTKKSSTVSFQIVQSGRQSTLHSAFASVIPSKLEDRSIGSEHENHHQENGHKDPMSTGAAPLAISYKDFSRISHFSTSEMHQISQGDANFFVSEKQAPAFKVSHVPENVVDSTCSSHTRLSPKQMDKNKERILQCKALPAVHPADWPLLLASGFHLTHLCTTIERKSAAVISNKSKLPSMDLSKEEPSIRFMSYRHQHGMDALLNAGIVDSRTVWWAASYLANATSSIDIAIQVAEVSDASASQEDYLSQIIELYWTPVLALTGISNSRLYEELPAEIRNMVEKCDPLRSPDTFIDASVALLRQYHNSQGLLELEIESRTQKVKAESALESLLIRDFQNQYVMQQPHCLVGPHRPELVGLPWAMGLPFQHSKKEGNKSQPPCRYDFGHNHPMQYKRLYNQPTSTAQDKCPADTIRATRFYNGMTGYPLIDACIRCLKKTGTLPQRWSLPAERIQYECKNECLQREKPPLVWDFSSLPDEFVRELSIALDDFPVTSMHFGLMLLANFWCKYLMLPWGLGVEFIAGYSTEWNVSTLCFVFQWASGLLLEPSGPSLSPATLIDPQSDTVVDLLDINGNFTLRWVPELLGCAPGITIETVALDSTAKKQTNAASDCVVEICSREYSCELELGVLSSFVRKPSAHPTAAAPVQKEEKKSKWSFGAMMKFIKHDEGKDESSRPTKVIPSLYQREYAQLPESPPKSSSTFMRITRNGRVPLGSEFVLPNSDSNKKEGYCHPVVDAWLVRRCNLSAVQRLYWQHMEWISYQETTITDRKQLYHSLARESVTAPLLRSYFCHLPSWEADELCQQCSSATRAGRAVERLGLLGKYFDDLNPRSPKSDDKAHHDAEKLPFDIRDGVVAELGYLWEDKEARSHQEDIRFNDTICELSTLVLANRHLFPPKAHTISKRRFSFADRFHDTMLMTSCKSASSIASRTIESTTLERMLSPIKSRRTGLSNLPGKREAQLHSINVSMQQANGFSTPSCMLAPFFLSLRNLAWANSVPDRTDLLETLSTCLDISENLATKILPSLQQFKWEETEVQDDFEWEVESHIASVQGAQKKELMSWVYSSSENPEKSFSASATKLLYSFAYQIASSSDASWGCVRGQWPTSPEDGQYLYYLNREEVYSDHFKPVVENQELGMHVYMHTDPDHETGSIPKSLLESATCTNWYGEFKPAPSAEYMERPMKYYPSGKPRKGASSHDGVRTVTGTITLPNKESKKVAEAVVDLTNYRRWDRSWENITELCRLDCHNSICYKLADTPAPPFSAVVCQRDAVLFRASYNDSSNASLAICFRNGFHCLAPPRHPYVRAVLLGVSGFTITDTGPSSSATTFTSSADFRGKVPSFLVNFVAKKSPATWAKRLHGIIQALEEEGYFKKKRDTSRK